MGIAFGMLVPLGIANAIVCNDPRCLEWPGYCDFDLIVLSPEEAIERLFTNWDYVSTFASAIRSFAFIEPGLASEAPPLVLAW